MCLLDRFAILEERHELLPVVPKPERLPACGGLFPLARARAAIPVFPPPSHPRRKAGRKLGGPVDIRPPMTLQISLGPYLADELVLPFVLAGGGSLTIVKPSQHAMTASDIAKRFTGRRIELVLQSGGEHLLTVGWDEGAILNVESFARPVRLHSSKRTSPFMTNPRP